MKLDDSDNTSEQAKSPSTPTSTDSDGTERLYYTGACPLCGHITDKDVASHPSITSTDTKIEEAIEEILDRYQFHFAHQFTHKEDPFTKEQATTALKTLLTSEKNKAVVEELEHIDNPTNVWLYYEGLISVKDRIKELKNE